MNAALVKRSFVTRRGRIPVPTQIETRSLGGGRDMLIARVDASDSGSLYVPYVDRDGCFYFASTTTLSQSAAPRSLYLELSRGQLYLLTQKLSDWQTLGFRLTSAVRSTTRHAVNRFARLVSSDYDSPDFDSECFQYFSTLSEFNQRVNETFLNNVLTSRRALADPWPTKFGFAAPIDRPWRKLYDSAFKKRGPLRASLEPFFQTFNPDFSWREVECEDGFYRWTPLDAAYAQAAERGMETTVGPLIRWGERLPQFLQGRSNDDAIYLFKRYLKTLFERDAGRTRRWIVATNVEENVGSPSLETRLVLAAETASAIKKYNPSAQAFLGFEQPFGDGFLRGAQCMSPLELAVKVARRKVFDGFYLEVNFGLTDDSTPPRDPMELHRFFDRWCSLGTPICLGLSCPSSASADQAAFEASSRLFDARMKNQERGLSDDGDLLAPSPEYADAETELWNEKNQRETTRRFICAALSRRNVDEILWTKFADSPSVRDPNEEPRARTGETTEIPLDCPCSPYSDEADVEISLCGDEREEFDVELDVSTARKTRKRPSKRDPRDPQRFPTSGLFDEREEPKSTLYKLSATKHAYIS